MILTPDKYLQAAVLAHEAGEEMLSRLEWMAIKPRVVVDLGAGTGEMSARLKSRYAEAHVIALDLSEAMLNHSRQANTQISCICADANRLPFADQSIDLVFANFLFPWVENLPTLLRECHRILCPEGLLIFTALGLDTFGEWREVLESHAAVSLVDMHDAGDLLLKNHFVDPVLDVNYYTLTYRGQSRLLDELQDSGMVMSLPNPALVGTVPPSEDGRFEVSYEVIFAHAFAAEKKTAEICVPVSSLRKRS